MDEKAYLNFDLQLEAVGQNYRAEVLESPAGKASVTFRLPFTPTELDKLVESLGKGAATTSALVKDFGWRLFNAALGGEVQNCLSNSLAEAGKQNTGLCLRLHLSKAPELAELPWEFLYYPPLNSFLALLERVTIIRYLQQAAPVKPPPVELPIKVMVLISSPQGFARFDPESEWAKLNLALDDLLQAGLVLLERLDEPNLTAMQMKFWWGKYHVLHYIGHGYFEEKSKDGVLVLADDRGQSQLASSSQLGALLRDHPSLRLAILQACPGAITSLNDGFESTAEHLLEEGLPAVLALTYATSEGATRALLGTLYNALAGGQWLDRTLGETRGLVYLKGHDFEWGSSQLYLGSAEGRVFEVTSLSNEQRAAAFGREAQTALSRQDWPGAIEKLEKVLALQPDQPEAARQLIEARHQQELLVLYNQGQEAYQAQKWQEAQAIFQQLQSEAGHYKDVATLLEFSQQAHQQQELAALAKEAEAAAAKQDWALNIEKLEKVLALDPTQAEGPLSEKLAQARHELELEKLYKAGLAQYQFQHWCEALESFEQLQKIAGQYKDLDNLIRTSDEECRRSQIGVLPQEAQAAFAREDWALAVQKLQALLKLDPLQYEAKEKLGQAEAKLALAKLYNSGQTAYQAQDWPAALEIFQQLKTTAGPYKDLDALITDSQAKIAQSQQQAHIVGLYSQAQTAAAKEEWALAVEKLQEILKLDPTQIEADTRLSQAHQQQDLATLYFNGHANYEAGRWREALDAFRQIHNTAGAYKEVESLIAVIEGRVHQLAADDSNSLDFDLQFEPAGSGYRVQVLNSPAGKAGGTFRLPFSAKDLDKLAADLGLGGPMATGAAKDFGWKLFNAVFAGEVQLRLSNSLAEVGRRNSGLRLRLLFEQTPELAELPWEFLYYPPFNSYLALLERVTVVRYIALAEKPKALLVKLPLRVLAIVSGSDDYSPTQAEDDWVRFSTALEELQQGSLLMLERVKEASLPALQQQLLCGQYQVLHFIGQGVFGGRNDEGLLTLLDKAGQYQSVTIQELKAVLAEHASLRLVVLQTSRAEPVGRTDPLGEISQSLTRLGLPAVVALPRTATAEAVNADIAALYSAITRGLRLDEALSETRLAVYNKGHDVEWGISRLYLSSPDGRVFDVEPLSPAQRIAALHREAQVALARENWPVAISKLEGVVALDTSFGEAASQLTEARRQQELGGLYNSGLKAYQAGRWCESAEQFRQLQAVASDYKNVPGLLASSEEACRKLQLTALDQEAQTAARREDWASVVQKLEQLIELDPAQAQSGIGIRLNYAHKQLELADLYATGQQHYKAGRWAEALASFQRLQALDSDYRSDIEAFIADSTEKAAEAAQQSQFDNLKAEILEAATQEDWKTANDKLKELQGLGSQAEIAAQLLSFQVRERQNLAIAYMDGKASYEGGFWHEALKKFQEIQDEAGQYKDVDNLIADTKVRLSQDQPDAFQTFELPDALKMYQSPAPAQAQTQVYPPPAPAQSQTYAGPTPPNDNSSGQAQTRTQAISIQPPPAPVYSPAPANGAAGNGYPAQPDPAFANASPGATAYAGPPPAANPPELKKKGRAAILPVIGRGPNRDNGHKAETQKLPPARPIAPPKERVRRTRTETVPVAVRILWAILPGWVLGYFWSNIAYFFCALWFTMPLGLRMLHWLPTVLTLHRDSKANAPARLAARLNDGKPQRNIILRLFWWFFLGSWLGGVWIFASYVLCALFFSRATGKNMFKQVPAIMTLRRTTTSRPAYVVPSKNVVVPPPNPQDRKFGTLATLFFIAWGVVPAVLILMWLLRVFVIK